MSETTAEALLLAELLEEVRELKAFVHAQQTPPEVNEELLDVAGLAERLKVGVRTARRWDALGKIPAPVRIGRALRWRLPEIIAWQLEGSPSRERWEAIWAARQARSTRLRNGNR